MSHQQKDTDFLAISTRIHAMETRLLTRERMERMIEAKDQLDAAKLLSECGYGELGTFSSARLERLLEQARTDTFYDLRGALTDHSVVEVFQLKYDYHNLKTLLKAQAVQAEAEPLLLSGGRYAAEWLRDAFRRDELGDLTPAFRAAAEQAKETLAVTGDPQRADFLLDRACYAEMGELAAQSGSTFLQGYVRLVVDAANLRGAVRAARLGKGVDFLAQFLLPGGNLDERTLAAARGEDLATLYQTGPLAEAAAVGARLVEPHSGPLTSFERLCDDAVTNYLSAARRVPFGVETVICYLYARENESTAIRTILSGRAAGLDGDTIRSRLRAAYA